MAWADVLKAVRAQISAAVQGKTLRAVNEAGTTNWFWTPATNTTSANALVAYWLAVAARLGSPQLLAASKGFYATATSWTSFASSSPSAIAAVLDQGVAALDSVGAYKDRRFAGIYRAFGQYKRADLIEQAQILAYEQTGLALVAGGIKGTAADLVDAAAKAGNIITNKKPPGTPDWLWWLQRNAWFIVGGTVAAGALYLFLRPVLAPAFGVRDAAAAASRRLASKATAQIATVASNPRRRRRLRSR